MKKLIQISFVALLLFAISACEKKSCSSVVCASYQFCYSGECLCPNGYEGDTCSVLSSTKYTGNWLVIENCGADPTNFSGYSTNIAPTVTGTTYYAPNVIYFNFLFGSGPVYAQLLNSSAASEGLTIYIPPQTLSNGVSILSGSQGYYSAPVIAGGKPTMSITVNYAYQGNSYTCTESFRKQ